MSCPSNQWRASLCFRALIVLAGLGTASAQGYIPTPTLEDLLDRPFIFTNPIVPIPTRIPQRPQINFPTAQSFPGFPSGGGGSSFDPSGLLDGNLPDPLGTGTSDPSNSDSNPLQGFLDGIGGLLDRLG